ncbi:MAG: hypothetical protein K2K55_09085 [Duncaniella sp.]|nr:hypothetical protein [Duncaniella sp.]
MIKTFSALVTALLVLMTAAGASAQTVTTQPAMVNETTADITITFHADGGNRGLLGSTASTPVYAHTGLITSKSTSPSDWRYATTWGDNNDKYKLTYAGGEEWTLTIPSIRTFYGVTDPSEKIEKICFVFRNASGSREGKTAVGGDVFVEIFPQGFPASKQAAYPGGKPKMGAVSNTDGSVTFCLAAPQKQNVVMIGSWNNDYSLSEQGVMNYQDLDGVRYFWQTVSGLEAGKDYPYYFLVDGTERVGDPYAHLVLDPWNDSYIPSSVFPDLPAYPSKKVSAVPLAVYNSAIDKYDWNVADFKGVPQDRLIIYELLIRDFTGTEGKSNANGTVKGVIGKLDYLKALGVNAIELLPIMEFNGNNSWGYNTNFYMAPDKAYGTPDDYRAMIDGAHERGMAVILDIVFNQSDGAHPWYGLYTRKNTPFYNGSAPHAYSVLNDWNQDCALVQQQWYDALDYWMEAYKVDGFRFDLVKGLGNNNTYGTTYNAATNTWSNPTDAGTNAYNASRVARMKALHDHMRLTRPDAYFINENLAGAKEENEMAADGEINWANINYNSCEYAMGWKDNASLNRFYAPLDDNRLPGSTVSYAESHDEERVAYKVKMYGNTGIKGNMEMTCRRLGSLAAQMFCTPGAHMIWQFEELADDQTTKASDGGNDTSPKKVMWSYLDNPDRKSLHDTYADLLRFRAANPTLFTTSAKTLVSLSTWTGRSVSLADAEGREIYLMVNPEVSQTLTVASPRNAATNATVDLSASGYQLLASSAGVTPTATASGVTLPAGAFALYGKDVKTAITDIEAEKTAPQISVGADRCISVDGDYETLAVYDLSGRQLSPSSALAAGLYIIKVDGYTAKVIVR